MSIVRLSPAKVNLYLKVLRKRADGYHDIATLMQKISLYDEMIFTPQKEGISVKCPGSSLPENEDNIVFRAAKAFYEHSSCKGGIEITIKKSIPIAAGLGGGSSNAATTLMTMNELAGFPISSGYLIKIGARIGADVPFFIFGQTAWAFGIGDRLDIAENIPQMSLILIYPRFEISTKMVYENLNLRLTKEPINYSVPQFSSIRDIASGMHNDLERVAFELHPVLQDLKDVLIEQGALGTLMSGSGSAVFGLYADESSAESAKDVIEKLGKWSVFSVHSI